MLPYHYGILPRKYESFSTLLCLGLTKAYIKAETVAIFLNCPKGSTNLAKSGPCQFHRGEKVLPKYVLISCLRLVQL